MKRQPEAKRSDRIASQIRDALMQLVTQGRLRDPELSTIWLTDVKLTDDLRIAYVYVRSMQGLGADTADPAHKKTIHDIEKKLAHAAPFLRTQLAKMVRLRYNPELRFFWDNTYDNALRMETLLSNLNE